MKHFKYEVHFIKFKPDSTHFQHHHFLKCVTLCCYARISYSTLILHPTLFSHVLYTCSPGKTQIVSSHPSSCALYASSRLAVSITIVPLALTSFLASGLGCPILFLWRHAFVDAITQVDVRDPLLLNKNLTLKILLLWSHNQPFVQIA